MSIMQQLTIPLYLIRVECDDASHTNNYSTIVKTFKALLDKHIHSNLGVQPIYNKKEKSIFE